MSKDWFQKSMDTLSLNGKGERTQQAYTRALRMLADFYGKRPEEITEAELEAYFVRRKNEDRWSSNTLRICYCGIRSYFVHVKGLWQPRVDPDHHDKFALELPRAAFVGAPQVFPPEAFPIGLHHRPAGPGFLNNGLSTTASGRLNP